MFAIFMKIAEQFAGEKRTNPFPVKYKPRGRVREGDLHDPVLIPRGFRGRITYNCDACIGCRMCLKVCPAGAIEEYPVIAGEKRSRRIIIFLQRCAFCGECVAVCPGDALVMERDCFMAALEKNGDDLVVGIHEKRTLMVRDEEDDQVS